MGIDWSQISDSRLEYFCSRHLSHVEADIAGWHYWAFYTSAPLYNELEQVHVIEGVFFMRAELATDGKAIEKAFHVPGAWLHDANGMVYRILHDQIGRAS